MGFELRGPSERAQKIFEKLFYEKSMREYTYVGAAVKIGIVDRATTTTLDSAILTL